MVYLGGHSGMWPMLFHFDVDGLVDGCAEFEGDDTFDKLIQIIKENQILRR